MEIARHLGEPLRKEFNLPPGTNVDLLLCALYHRTFITERHDKPPQEGSPFMEPHAAFARFAAARPEVEQAVAVGKDEGK